MNNNSTSSDEKTESLNDVVTQMNTIRVQLSDMNSSVEDYIIRDPTSNNRYQRLSIKIKKKDKLDSIYSLMDYTEYLFDLLWEYKEYVELLLSDRYLNIITMDTSDTYSTAYINKCKTIRKKISDLEKSLSNILVKDVSSYSFKGVDMESLSKYTVSFTKILILIVEKLGDVSEKYSVSKFVDNILVPDEMDEEPKEVKSCVDKMPLISMGIDFNLKPTNANLSLKTVNEVKKVFKILINNNVKTSSSKVFYDLDKILNQKLSMYKKVTGLTADLVNLLDSVKYDLKPTVETLPKEKCPGIKYIKDSGPIRIYETTDGLNYNIMKLRDREDIFNMNYGNISLGPKNSIKYYNKLTDEIILDNSVNVGTGSRNNTMMLPAPIEPTIAPQLDLLEYRDKTVEEIYDYYIKTHTTGTTDTKSKSLKAEYILMNVYRANEIEAQVFKTRKEDEPTLQDIHSVMDLIN